MTKKFTTRTTRIVVAPEGESTFSERATEIQITDEGAGEFIEVAQPLRTDAGKISIDPEEWPAIRAGIDEMVKNCKD